MTQRMVERVQADATHARRERADRFAARRDHLLRLSRGISRARMITFGGAVAALLWAEVGGPGQAGAGLPAGVVLAAAFVALLFVHRRVRVKRDWFEALRRVNVDAIARIRRDWRSLARPAHQPAVPASHPYAHDLDVVGHASLFRLVDVTGSAPGRATLLDWLLEPAGTDEIRDRQDAVRELLPLADFRDRLSARSHLTGASEPAVQDVERFLAWAEGEPWLLARPALLWATRLLPVTTLVLAVLAGTGAVPWSWISIPVLVQLGLTAVAGKRAWAAFGDAFSRDSIFQHQAGLFHDLTRQPFTSPLLARLQAELTANGTTAAMHMRRLARLASFAEVRYSPMAHFPLQLLLLWDFHVLYALERWQRSNGRSARQWLAALGQIDALAALAALAADHPHWSLPEVATDAAPPRVEATGLAHPLLEPAVARANDVEIGPPGTFLLVTGSNMSGKSTLLRAIGTNLVLAQAGGPVCAHALRFPPLQLHTSMRVQDSLEAGVSFFMAELQRLKRIVDAASAARADSRALLYLLDEILQGTNTAERQLAAKRILLHLLERGAIGVVTTHDLTLAQSKALAGPARLVHFRETIERVDGEMRMTFDYRLRPGLATSTNALALMELVGLGRPEG